MVLLNLAPYSGRLPRLHRVSPSASLDKINIKFSINLHVYIMDVNKEMKYSDFSDRINNYFPTFDRLVKDEMPATAF